jgi:hypothetical protein
MLENVGQSSGTDSLKQNASPANCEGDGVTHLRAEPADLYWGLPDKLLFQQTEVQAVEVLAATQLCLALAAFFHETELRVHA